jgi:hypothetical protein
MIRVPASRRASPTISRVYFFVDEITSVRGEATLYHGLSRLRLRFVIQVVGLNQVKHPYAGMGTEGLAFFCPAGAYSVL